MGKYIDIISRTVWGNRYGLGWTIRALPAKYVTLHHSVTAAPPVNATFDQDAAAVRLLDQIGYDRFKYADTGWTRPAGAGISYTWAVTPSGRVFEGHDIKRAASHTIGYNTTGVGICLIGNYDKDTVTPQQIEAVARLLLEAKENGWIEEPNIDFNHKDVYATACPGANALGAKTKINARALEIQKGGTTVDPNKGFTTSYIKEVQTALKTLGYYTGTISGSLPDVDKAVRAFQTDNSLVVDGQPGDNTMGVIKTRLAEYIERKAAEEAAAKAEAERLAREKAIAEAVSKSRLNGANRWETANLTAMTSLPAGRGILIAADGSADERYASARAGGEVIYLPVRMDTDKVPAQVLAAVADYKPTWVRFVGGLVTDGAARAILLAANLI